MQPNKAEIISPLNNPSKIETILNNGADALYFGIQGAANSRNFSNINIHAKQIKSTIKRIHNKKKKAYMVLNSFPSRKSLKIKYIIKTACTENIDAIIVASFSMMQLIKELHPEQKIHVSVMAGLANPNSINFLSKHYNIEQVVIPSGLTFSEINHIRKNISSKIKLETVVLGTLGYGFQGRCHLARFLSGLDPNTCGVCSHPKYYKLKETNQKYLLYFDKILLRKFQKDHLPPCFQKLKKNNGTQLLNKEVENGWKNNFLVNKRYVCRGVYKRGVKYFRFQNYCFLNILPKLDKLINSGIDAVKIEGRQRPTQYSIIATKITKELLENSSDKYKRKHNQQINYFFPRMKKFNGGFNLEHE